MDDVAKLDTGLRGALEASAAVEGTKDEAKGQAEFVLTNEGKRLRAASPFVWESGRLKLTEIEAKAEGAELSGNIDYTVESGIAEGKLALNAADLAKLRPFTGKEVHGQGSAAAELRNEKGRQAGRILGAFKTLVYGETEIDALDFFVEGDGKEADFRLSAEAGGAKPWALRTKGNAAFALPDWRVRIAELQGRYLEKPFELEAPATLSRKQSALSRKQSAFALDAANLTVGNGSVMLKGAYAPQRVNADMNIRALPLEWLTQEKITGLLNGDIALTGTPQSPQLKAAWNADIRGDAAAKLPPLSLKGTATLAKGRLNAQAARQGEGVLKAEISLPAAFSLSPVNLSIDSGARITGTARLDSEIGTFAALFLPPGQTLNADAEGSLAFTGTLSQPQAKGELRLKNGRYDNRSSGTALRGLDALFRIDAARVNIESLNASDGGEGRLTAGGNVSLKAPYALDIRAQLQDFAAVKTRAATGEVNGAVRLTGAAAAPLVEGNVVLGPMEIRLPEEKAVDIKQVKILNPEALPGWEAEAEKHEGGSAVRLNVDVSVPSRVFVRGRGLETEMRGNLQLRGTAAQPLISGELRTVRGQFTLLDRALTIQEGVLTFQGPMPPSPFIRIRAETKAGRIVAAIALDGPALAPKLTLSSTPALPQDEILAMILFGRDARSITPFQAIQLAQAVQALRGGGGGMDLLGKVRDKLGVDRISVGESESGDVAVGAGKYVSDRVYIGVEGGAGEDAGKVKAEIELTPSISLETESGARSTGARLNWKRDY